MNQRPAPFRLALIVPVVAAFYYAGAQVGLALTFPPATTSVLWPPNAILTAALLMIQPRRWWIVLAAALPVHIWLELNAGFPARLVALLFVTNCSEALLAALAVRAFSDAPTQFDSFRRVAAFICGAGLLAPIVSSFADAAVVNQLRGEDYWDVFRVRVFSNVLTELSVAPALITAWHAAQAMITRRPRAPRALETFAFLVVMIGLALVVFGRPGVRDALPGTPPTPIILLLPAFGWAAMRFGVGGVSAALLASAAVASYETAEGLRPFATLTPIDSLIAVQMILAVAAMPLMLIAGLLGDRRRATADLAARLRFEELLSSIAGSFLRVTDDAVALRTSLARVSEFFDANYVALVQFGGATEVEAESEWRGPGVVNLTAEAVRRRFPSAMARAQAGETVAWTNADVIPHNASQDFLSFDEFAFRFLVILPFAGDQIVRGALLVATTRHRAISPSDLAQLRLIADVIATAHARRRAELDAQRSRQEVTQMARRSSMGELASALAHQLNQPLAGIMANAQAAQRLIQRSSPQSIDVHEGLGDIVEDCRRASDVVQRVRDMVAPTKVQMAPLDLSDVVREVAMLLSSDALIRRVRLALEYGSDATRIRGDRVLLQQAVLNVIINGIDAVADQREGDRVVTVWTGRNGGDHARIRVRDQGKGLAPGSHGQVFEPFFSTKATGLGMGLAISRSIVESHGGTIQLDSDSTGVVVTIDLPVAELVS